jgi:hypothetical protein
LGRTGGTIQRDRHVHFGDDDDDSLQNEENDPEGLEESPIEFREFELFNVIERVTVFILNVSPSHLPVCRGRACLYPSLTGLFAEPFRIERSGSSIAALH